MSFKYLATNFVVAAALSFLPTQAISQDDLRAAVQNPISSMYSLPLKFSYDSGAENGNATMLNIQPVIPITVGNLNFVNRLIIPLASIPGPISGMPNNPNPSPGNGANGLGDINYSVFVSPVKTGKIIWGVGPSISLPTATDGQLGSGKWSIGPTAVALTTTSWGSYGGLARHLWSFAGADSRQRINQSLMEPFLNYNLDDGWFLNTDMVITSNWDANSENRWTIPVGGGIGRLIKIGKQPVNLKLEYYYNVVRPTGAPKWNTAFTVQFLFPKK